MRADILVLAIAALLLTGGAIAAYTYNPDIGFDAYVNDDSDTVIEITGTFPAEVAYRVLSNTSVPDRIYIFLDEKYPGLTGYRDQRKTLTTFADMLSKRGYVSTEIIDSVKLAQIISDPSEAASSGLMMTGGAIPANIFPDDSDNGILTWISNGGTLYWSGPDIGMYRDTGEECVQTSCTYFGTAMNYQPDKEYLVSDASEVAEFMEFSDKHAEYGLSADYSANPTRMMGLYGDYSSLSVTGIGSGRVYLFGNYLDRYDIENLTAIADMVVCGITEDTVLVEKGMLSKEYGTQKFNIGSIAVGSTVYVTLGKPVTERGETFIL